MTMTHDSICLHGGLITPGIADINTEPDPRHICSKYRVTITLMHISVNDDD